MANQRAWLEKRKINNDTHNEVDQRSWKVGRSMSSENCNNGVVGLTKLDHTKRRRQWAQQLFAEEYYPTYGQQHTLGGTLYSTGAFTNGRCSSYILPFSPNACAVLQIQESYFSLEKILLQFKIFAIPVILLKCPLGNIIELCSPKECTSLRCGESRG